MQKREKCVYSCHAITYTDTGTGSGTDTLYIYYYLDTFYYHKVTVLEIKKAIYILSETFPFFLRKVLVVQSL